MKNTIIITGLFIIVSAFSFLDEIQKRKGNFEIRSIEEMQQKKVADILELLDDRKPYHYNFKKFETDSVKVRQGLEIFTLGKTIGPNGKKSKRQSKHFVCTDCHNLVIEDPDLRHSNPDTRLDYAVEHKIPFLQGTTMYGIVNREHWYNDDYQIKYGNLVLPSRDTLVNAIHLCSVECSQGRALDKWELKAVMAYLYSIGYNISDLNLNNSELAIINKAISSNVKEEKTNAIALIKSKYFVKSPATFLTPLTQKDRKYGASGNPNNGRKLYESSCLFCHKVGRVTEYILDNEKLTFKHLEKHLFDNTHYSIYEITRKGTYAKNGYKSYMPNYTLERMSHQQLEDLVGYINQEAKRKNK